MSRHLQLKKSYGLLRGGRRGHDGHAVALRPRRRLRPVGAPQGVDGSRYTRLLFISYLYLRPLGGTLLGERIHVDPALMQLEVYHARKLRIRGA